MIQKLYPYLNILSRIAFPLLLLLTTTSSAFADVYEYRDDSGTRHFVDSIDKVPTKFQKQINGAKQLPKISRAKVVLGGITTQNSNAPRYLRQLLPKNSANKTQVIQLLAATLSGFCILTLLLRPTNLVKILGVLSVIFAAWSFGALPVPEQYRLTEIRGTQSEWSRKMHELRALHKRGRKGEALRQAKVLLTEAEGSFSRLDIRRIEAVHDVGWLSYDLKRDREAERYLQRSLKLYSELILANQRNPSSKLRGPSGVHGVGNEHVLLGDIAARNGRRYQARQHYEKALSFFRKRLPHHKSYYESIRQRLRSLG